MSKKNKNKMPPPAPIFWKKVAENQVSYFIWPNVRAHPIPNIILHVFIELRCG